MTRRLETHWRVSSDQREPLWIDLWWQGVRARAGEQDEGNCVGHKSGQRGRQRPGNCVGHKNGQRGRQRPGPIHPPPL